MYNTPVNRAAALIVEIDQAQDAAQALPLNRPGQWLAAVKADISDLLNAASALSIAVQAEYQQEGNGRVLADKLHAKWPLRFRKPTKPVMVVVDLPPAKPVTTNAEYVQILSVLATAARQLSVNVDVLNHQMLDHDTHIPATGLAQAWNYLQGAAVLIERLTAQIQNQETK